MNLGMTEIILLLVIVLFLFGPSRLPSLGKAVGETIKGFKKGLNEEDSKPAQLSASEAEKAAEAKKQKENS